MASWSGIGTGNCSTCPQSKARPETQLTAPDLMNIPRRPGLNLSSVMQNPCPPVRILLACRQDNAPPTAILADSLLARRRRARVRCQWGAPNRLACVDRSVTASSGLAHRQDVQSFVQCAYEFVQQMGFVPKPGVPSTKTRAGATGRPTSSSTKCRAMKEAARSHSSFRRTPRGKASLGDR